MSDNAKLVVGKNEDYMTNAGMFPDGQNIFFISILNEDATPLDEVHTLNIRSKTDGVTIELTENNCGTERLISTERQELSYDFQQSEKFTPMYNVKITTDIQTEVQVSFSIDNGPEQEFNYQSYDIDHIYSVADFVNVEDGSGSSFIYAFVNPDAPEYLAGAIQFSLNNVANTSSKVINVSASFDDDSIYFTDIDGNKIASTVDFQATSNEVEVLYFKADNFINSGVTFNASGHNSVYLSVRYMDIKYMPEQGKKAEKKALLQKSGGDKLIATFC